METHLKNDRVVIRELARQYAEIAEGDRNTANIKLHRAVNDLQQVRPVVLIDELPWSEMQIADELTLRCSDAFLRQIEWRLRTTLYQQRYLPADMVVAPYLGVGCVTHSTGIGITVQEEVLATDAANGIVSHQYKDQLQSEEDLARLELPVISYDREATLKRLALLEEAVGDLIPVKRVGIGAFHFSPWDAIATYRGVENLLVDLAMRPEFMHRVVRKLTDISLAQLRQYEDLGLLDGETYSLHCTPGLTRDLPGPLADGGRLLRGNIWGRGAAQIFAHVSREMHEEFDIAYMKEVVGRCGLVYYGCCEPLDRKIDLVEKIPNLRKISVTPWADVKVAAEAIGRRYVLSAKPNPAAVAVSALDKAALRREIAAILDACRQNGCACDLVLKDISTCHRRPQNIFEWEQTVMEMVRNG